MSLSPKHGTSEDGEDGIADILDILETDNGDGGSASGSGHGEGIGSGEAGGVGLGMMQDAGLARHAGMEMMEAELDGELLDDGTMGAGGDFGGDYEVKEQDKWLPIANVARIMKMALPDNAKISKEAKECMQECVSEFISFITSEASEKCSAEKRKTVNGEDILFAMTSLGFENYSETLKIYLAKYRQFIASRTGAGPGK
ncbi:histone-fold-containing protein [Lipomyces oligophaga]|uniref:histone-fold-containing protein n=1 Tax=Lipomyces oligophaga TaxID=45792 RepID=UPI0034CFD816